MHIVTQGVTSNAPYQQKGCRCRYLIALLIFISFYCYCVLDFMSRTCLHAQGPILLHGVW